jgi:hypothetical protein
MDTRPNERQGALVARHDERLGITELLATAAANVAAVPVVLGFVALGGVVLAGRVLFDAAGQVIGARGRRRGSRRSRAPEPRRSR